MKKKKLLVYFFYIYKYLHIESLFPSWLPGSFGVMFATPFPSVSSSTMIVYYYERIVILE